MIGLHTMRLVWAILPVAFFGGCISLGRAVAPPMHRYAIAYPTPLVATTSVPAIIEVLPLRIAAAYDRNDIVYRDGEHRLDTYNYRRWTAHPARMIRDALERDFIAAEAFTAVVAPPSVLTADYVLDGVVEQVEERLDPRCSAHLRIRFLLARQSERLRANVLFQRVYEVDETCVENDPETFAAAMSRAMAAISGQLLTDLVTVIAADLSENPR